MQLTWVYASFSTYACIEKDIYCKKIIVVEKAKREWFVSGDKRTNEMQWDHQAATFKIKHIHRFWMCPCWGIQPKIHGPTGVCLIWGVGVLSLKWMILSARQMKKQGLGFVFQICCASKWSHRKKKEDAQNSAQDHSEMTEQKPAFDLLFFSARFLQSVSGTGEESFKLPYFQCLFFLFL